MLERLECSLGDISGGGFRDRRTHRSGPGGGACSHTEQLCE
jgi:hypothetical protein